MTAVPSFSNPEYLLVEQREQFSHDRRNHSDVLCLPRADRLKHYGLHFAKYAGRVARGTNEAKSFSATLVDATLVCLSTANALNQRFDREVSLPRSRPIDEPDRFLTDAAGRFADACEKIDHLEEFLAIAKAANLDLLYWVISEAERVQLDLPKAVKARRSALAMRAFYVGD